MQSPDRGLAQVWLALLLLDTELCKHRLAQSLRQPINYNLNGGGRTCKQKRHAPEAA
jgi:hypothetical protein